MKTIFTGKEMEENDDDNNNESMALAWQVTFRWAGGGSGGGGGGSSKKQFIQKTFDLFNEEMDPNWRDVPRIPNETYLPLKVIQTTTPERDFFDDVAGAVCLFPVKSVLSVEMTRDLVHLQRRIREKGSALILAKIPTTETASYAADPILMIGSIPTVSLPVSDWEYTMASSDVDICIRLPETETMSPCHNENSAHKSEIDLLSSPMHGMEIVWNPSHSQLPVVDAANELEKSDVPSDEESPATVDLLNLSINVACGEHGP